ncbi:hypothetical protein RAB80_014384 [Fusarium oxysporum f. sp. vasinfectum]|nr:hypothetical protein RAB80_014719 [Fusarium oxysporum f. sp. vasinfectum]KAK2670247.1 hypothetical protein RAB80_014384 [Fusarium oxysporum f. sp. vasinfectum]
MAAVGMTNNLPQLRAIEGSRIHVWSVDSNAYVQWIWRGTQ